MKAVQEAGRLFALSPKDRQGKNGKGKNKSTDGKPDKGKEGNVRMRGFVTLVVSRAMKLRIATNIEIEVGIQI